jgi:hypothetical protein
MLDFRKALAKRGLQTEAVESILASWKTPFAARIPTLTRWSGYAKKHGFDPFDLSSSREIVGIRLANFYSSEFEEGKWRQTTQGLITEVISLATGVEDLHTPHTRHVLAGLRRKCVKPGPKYDTIFSMIPVWEWWDKESDHLSLRDQAILGISFSAPTRADDLWKLEYLKTDFVDDHVTVVAWDTKECRTPRYS